MDILVFFCVQMEKFDKSIDRGIRSSEGFLNKRKHALTCANDRTKSQLKTVELYIREIEIYIV